jgi:betaine-aldehyde dehydrogenase
VTGFGVPVGTTLSAHPEVDMISFTGSTEVGREVMAAARFNLKKVELELGGKNPQIVFPDADLEAAIDAIVFGVYFNMGECCNSGSRVLLHRDLGTDFVSRIIDRARQVKVGDPLDEKTKVGAIINEEQFDKILGYVESGKETGAQLRLGGERLDLGKGRYIAPTVFTGVEPEMAIAKEEVFGPVLSVLTFNNPAEAIRIANSTMYGLSAGVWTRDVDTAFQVIQGVRAGTIWVNTFMDGYPELSFGGYKQSGLGRELGRFALDEFTELKTVQLHLGPRQNWWVSREGTA